MLAHELLRNYHRNNGARRCALKIDLRKAYDCIRWDALLTTLDKFHIPQRFINWVSMCITAPKFSIMVNGSAYGYIEGKRGIRQGCPLSPYLFVLLMEVFNTLMLKQVQLGFYSLHPRCKNPIVTHLCFADDLLVCMKGDVQSGRSLSSTLTTFSNRTGLEVNNRKSSIFISSVDATTSLSIQAMLRFEVGLLPVRYLGLPLLSSRLSHSDCVALIDHVIARIKSWKERSLSFAGRVLLNKVILSSMLIFWTSCFVLRKKTVNTLNAIFRNFLWSGIELTHKHPSVKWSFVCLPYKEGGLGIRCIEATNTASKF